MKQIPGFPKYKITKDGRIWSIKNKKFLKQHNIWGYKDVTLCKKG